MSKMTPQQTAAWMASYMERAGLPAELPVIAGLVESNMQNLPGGDRDSQGYFQMRTGIWNTGKYRGYSNKPELQMQWFLDQARSVRQKWSAQGKSLSPGNYGEFVADIERPAEQYRGRYQERMDQARQLLSATNVNYSTTGSTGLSADKGTVKVNTGSSPLSPSSPTDTLSGRRAMLLQYIQDRQATPFQHQTALMGKMLAASPVPMISAPVVVDPQISSTGQETPGVAPARSTVGQAVAQAARNFLGVKYVWGGTTPDGFDCSGLMKYVFGKQGINIPRVTYDQFKAGKKVDPNNMQVGDLVFFHPGAQGPGHVGMNLGNGQFLHAPHTGDVVKVSSYNNDSYKILGVRRYG